MSRGWKSSEVHARQSLPDWEQSIKSNSAEGSERDEKRQRANSKLPGEYLSGLEQNVEIGTIKAILMWS